MPEIFFCVCRLYGWSGSCNVAIFSLYCRSGEEEPATVSWKGRICRICISYPFKKHLRFSSKFACLRIWHRAYITFISIRLYCCHPDSSQSHFPTCARTSGSPLRVRRFCTMYILWEGEVRLIKYFFKNSFKTFSFEQITSVSHK